MHPAIQKLIDKYNIPTSERSCYNSYLWNGKNLALYWQRENWDEDCNNLLSLSSFIPIDSYTLLHEIGHWLAADETEREFPEYGCMVGVVSGIGLCNGGFNIAPKLNLDIETRTREYRFLMDRMDGVLFLEEQSFREMCADLFSEYWADRFGIRVDGGNKGRCTYKVIDALNSPEKGIYDYETCWRAIIWLRENGLIV